MIVIYGLALLGVFFIVAAIYTYAFVGMSGKQKKMWQERVIVFLLVINLLATVFFSGIGVVFFNN